MKIISPTGLGIREQDQWGSGRFRAPRKKRVEGGVVRYEHRGADYRLCKPGKPFVVGTPVMSPCSGRVVRKAWPYGKGSHYSGILLDNEFGLFKLFYLSPFPSLLKVGTRVRITQEIGLAQDISKKYEDTTKEPMTPHVHLQILVHGNNLLSGKKEFINPEVLM